MNDPAEAMRSLDERERNVLIALGVMQRNVIDGRRRFRGDSVCIRVREIDDGDVA